MMRKSFQTQPQQPIMPSLRSQRHIYGVYNYTPLNHSLIAHTNHVNKLKQITVKLRPNLLYKSSINCHMAESREESQRHGCQNSDFLNTQRSHCKTYETDWQGQFAQQMKELMERVSNNEKQIEKLRKLQIKESATFKLQRDFMEIKDIYRLIKEHKVLQDQINKKFDEDVCNLKRLLPYFKEQIENSLKLHQLEEVKLTNIAQQIQGRLLAQLERNCLSETQRIVQQKISPTVSMLEQKVKSFEQELKTNRFSSLKRYFDLPINTGKTQQLVQVTAQEFIKKNDESKIYLHQFVYYIDENGYLLDGQKYYLLDQNSQMIKILDHHMPKIKQFFQPYQQVQQNEGVKYKGETITPA